MTKNKHEYILEGFKFTQFGLIESLNTLFFELYYITNAFAMWNSVCGVPTGLSRFLPFVSKLHYSFVILVKYLDYILYL